MKEEIFGFLTWLRTSRAIELTYDNGYDTSYALWGSEIEELIDHWIKYKEKMND